MTTDTSTSTDSVWIADVGYVPTWVADAGIGREYKRLQGHASRVDSAVTTAARGTAQLLTPQGEPIYADHDARMAAVEAEREQAVQDALAAIDAIRAEAEATLEREADPDSADRLTAAELERVNARLALVREDAERLPLSMLTKRLRDVLASDDRAIAYLWLRYAGQRLAAMHEQGIRPSNLAAATELDQVLRQGREHFIDHPARRRAEALIRAAREARSATWEKVKPVVVAREVAALRQSGRYGF